MTHVAFAVFFLSTTVFMKRGGYTWLPSILTGLVSPLGYLILFAIILLPTQLLIGKIGISEEYLPNRTIELSVATLILIGWCLGGFFLSRKKKPEVEPAKREI